MTTTCKSGIVIILDIEKLLVQMLYFLKFLVGVQSHFKFRKIGGGPKPLNRYF